jgi:CBS domain-containing protein
MRVADVLAVKGTDVFTIDRHRSVLDAAASLREHAIGALIVTGGGQPVAGILSERDIVRGLAQYGHEVLQHAVADLMSTEVVTCALETTIAELMALMTQHRIRHLPVTSDGRPIAMISIGDVVKFRLGELERDRQELLEYVQGR